MTFRKLMNLICALSLTLTSFSGFADSQAASLRTMPIYKETFNRCSKANHEGQFKSSVRAIWQGFDVKATRDGFTQSLQVATLNPSAISQLITNKGLSPRVSTMINSEEFYQALQDCFGANKGLKHTYIAGLIASDAIGKVAAVGVTVAAGWVTMKIITSVVLVYPSVQIGLMTFGATAGAMLAYNSLNETANDSTAAEREAARKLLANRPRDPDTFVIMTEAYYRKQIRTLKQQLPSATGESRARIQRRIIKLTGFIDQLQATEDNAMKLKT